MRSFPRAFLLLLASCASAPANPTAPPALPMPVATDGAMAGEGLDAGVAAAQPEPEPKRQLPAVDVMNMCHDVALLAYGDPPNFKSESLGRFAGDASGSADRERDGTLPVTLVDDKGAELAKVHISRRMKKLEIGRSCRTLYAH